MNKVKEEKEELANDKIETITKSEVLLTEEKTQEKKKINAKKKTTPKDLEKTNVKETKSKTNTNNTKKAVEGNNTKKTTKKATNEATTKKATTTTTKKSNTKRVEKAELEKNDKEITNKTNSSKESTKKKASTKGPKKENNSKTTENVEKEEKNKNTKQKKTKQEVNIESTQEIEEVIFNEEAVDIINENLEEDNNKTATMLEDSELSEILEENITENEEEKSVKKDGLHKYSIIIAVISILLFIGIVVFSTVFGLMNRTSDKIVSGVSIKNVDVSGLTFNEAEEKLSQMYDSKLKQNITLGINDYETSLTPELIESNFGIKESINLAYSIGRSGKVLKDNYAIINTAIGKINIEPSFTYNEELLNNIIEETSKNLPNKVQQSEYWVEEDNLVISKGKAGLVINEKELKDNILNNILDLNTKTDKIKIPVENKEPNKIDIEKIHSEIYKEAKDAYYTREPLTVYPHVVGIDFNIDEAKQLLNNEEEKITIPLKKTMPNITTNQIGNEAFPNLLATYSTTYSVNSANANRNTNITLAANRINGIVLMPGEEFSYNKIIGNTTVAKGYKVAPIYAGGRVTLDVGGGICQVSSTLYNTVLRANLEIVERKNHMFATGYVPLSTDATVAWGSKDFVFKNSRKYPIKIISSANAGKVKVDIYGCKEEVEYEVIVKSETLQTIPMRTENRINASLPKGTKKTVQSGHPGYKSRAYRILKLNGQVVSTQLLSTDTYAQLSTIIESN